ncbi:MAG: Uncharacterised protein [Flavobacterium sp. SCGC AAA160-P02]|nr:MAG: Uncharacterised protein [Flavobacterium sp. SCGC AAA160-P02]
MRYQLTVLFLLINIICYANKKNPAWGLTGHRVVGEIAYNHLTKKAKRNLENLINGEGLAIISTYADDIKSDKNFKKFSSWHYVNFKVGDTYETSEKNSKGDIIYAINECQRIISHPDSSKEDKVFYIKLLVHFLGDLHQPLHIGRAEDRGGNSISVKWFGKSTNLHSVWDTKMIESFNMSYSELTSNLDKFSKKQKNAIQQGTVLDWVRESRKLAMKVYESVKVDENLSYRYMYDYFFIVKNQLQKAGLRLAKILNEILG